MPQVGPSGLSSSAATTSRAPPRSSGKARPATDADIDAPIGMDAVLAAADPQLRALALQLGTATSVADFAAFYAAVDAVHGTINPADATSDASLAVLIGRPVALVQATLRLELERAAIAVSEQRLLQPRPMDGQRCGLERSRLSRRVGRPRPPRRWAHRLLPTGGRGWVRSRHRSSARRHPRPRRGCDADAGHVASDADPRACPTSWAVAHVTSSAC